MTSAKSRKRYLRWRAYNPPAGAKSFCASRAIKRMKRRDRQQEPTETQLKARRRRYSEGRR